MIDSSDRLAAISREHRATLNVLQQKPEFKALIALFRMEESNLKEVIAKNIPTSEGFSETIKQKLAIYRGRLEELRLIIWKFEDIKRKEKGGEPDAEG